ncbi:MAG: DUF2157 domain-containing protein [Tenacibaculum sp.]|nr:DUF2157 domain-containing protein [Tenacibaculum sp.]
MNIFNNFLKKEILKWQDKNIINRDTATKIASLYNIDLNKEDKKSSILQIIAFLFLGLSFIVLIGANWDSIPKFIRLFTVLAVVVGVNYAGYYWVKKGKENRGTAFFFLGNLCFGGAIALISQTYHLGENISAGLLFWTIGAMLMSLCTRKSLLIGQSLIIATIWYFTAFDMGGNTDIYLIFLIIGVISLYKQESRLLSFIMPILVYAYILSKHVNTNINNADLSVYISNILSYSLLILSLEGTLIEKGKISTANIFSKLAYITIVSVFIVCLFSNVFWFGDSEKLDVFSSTIFYYSVAFCLMSLFFSWKMKNKYYAIASVVLLLLPFITPVWTYSSIVFSVLSVLFGVLLINKDKLLLGLTIIFIVALIRYIDLIGDYIGASLLFLVFGVIILIVNFKRRKNEK